MPIHDWSRVASNRYHHFHQQWSLEIANALNTGLMPEGYFAMAEQRTGGPEPDVVALKMPRRLPSRDEGGLALADAPVKTRHVAVADATRYAEKANRLKLHSPDGDVVGIIEIVSPGNKDSRHAVKSFVRKAVQFLRAGIHMLIVDPFPPSKRDPQGLHPLIWEYFQDDGFTLPESKPLTLASYCAGVPITGYVEPFGVGDALKDMPIFLTEDRYVNVPLEATYQASWQVYPKVLKPLLEAV